MKKEIRYAVLGAGHGGRAMAAHLALMGYDVNLYNRSQEHIAEIAKAGGIHLESFEGGPRGFAKLQKITSDIGEAIQDVDVIMVVVPSTAHAGLARLSAPYLSDGQIVILHPGRTGGALEFHKTLRDSGCLADITIAEAETFIYASRAEGETSARIFGIKKEVSLAALPATRTESVLKILREAYPQFKNGGNVLETSLNNIGAIFHPALTLLNAGWIERTGGQFQFYIDGATPGLGRILEAVDRERVTVAAALGIRARTAREWLKSAYNAQGATLQEAIQNQKGYYGIQAPGTLYHRYIFEDVPMSLVPISALGRRYGVATPTMESLIQLANVLHQTDYWRRGRTLDKLGIQNLSIAELHQYITEESIEFASPNLFSQAAASLAESPQQENWSMNLHSLQ